MSFRTVGPSPALPLTDCVTLSRALVLSVSASSSSPWPKTSAHVVWSSGGFGEASGEWDASFFCLQAKRLCLVGIVLYRDWVLKVQEKGGWS